MLLGVISDTHGYLHSEVFHVFKSVDHILHAGDIGSEDVIRELMTIAPVTAVLGNGDYFRGYEKYSRIEVAVFDQIKILLTHQYPGYGKEVEQLNNQIHILSPQIIIFGHTHQPSRHKKDQILYFNPGSAGNTIYCSGKTVGLLTMQTEVHSGESIEAEIINLS